MARTRVIPVLLLRGRSLVKTVRFRKPNYLGDPINTIRLFNDKEVDEIVVLDIEATRKGARPQFNYIEDLAGESFMPMAVGGGIGTIDDVRRILAAGVEKVVVNTAAVTRPGLIEAIAREYGSSTLVCSMDVRSSFLGVQRAVTHGGAKRLAEDPVAWASQLERRGAGEILVNSVDRDGIMGGYDLDLVRRVAEAVSVPVIACGGAGDLSDMVAARDAGATAAAAGSVFVYHGRHRAVLIQYPRSTEIEEAFGEKD
ncbi:MAG: imidazole glycerol phosphate synthase subunit HisF [Planctomycetes bacterium]|nr:imidazole glycerol phosphate synthase subunit HisF [Planctomycetota bacterium]